MACKVDAKNSTCDNAFRGSANEGRRAITFKGAIALGGTAIA